MIVTSSAIKNFFVGIKLSRGHSFFRSTLLKDGVENLAGLLKFGKSLAYEIFKLHQGLVSYFKNEKNSYYYTRASCCPQNIIVDILASSSSAGGHLHIPLVIPKALPFASASLTSVVPVSLQQRTGVISSSGLGPGLASAKPTASPALASMPSINQMMARIKTDQIGGPLSELKRTAGIDVRLVY